MPDLDASGNAGLADALRRALSEGAIAEAVAFIVYTITERTRRGEFLPGSAASASQYSRQPFARPAGGLPRAVVEAFNENEALGHPFTTKTGALWLLIEGGYAQLRQMEGYQTSHVDLTKTGQTLDALRGEGRVTDDGLEIHVGYLPGLSDAEATQRARYHTDPSVARTLRRFVGLTDDELSQAIEIVRRRLTLSLSS